MHPFDSTVVSTYENYTSQILGTSEGKSKTKTAKNLKKVQRALKTLGVNFLHFDDQTAENDPAKSGEGVNSGSSCDKEYCRMGCVCDSVTGKYTYFSNKRAYSLILFKKKNPPYQLLNRIWDLGWFGPVGSMY